MGLTNFISQQTVVTAAWLNGVDATLNGPSAVLNVVTEFGVNNTGGSDTTTALLSAAASGQPLYIPPGTYKTNTTIPFTNSVYGVNPQGTVLLCSNLTVPTATIYGQTTLVQGINFAHSSLPVQGSGAHGLVLLAGSYQGLINNCQFTQSDNGLYVPTGSSAFWIRGCNGSNNAKHGFWLFDPNYMVSECYSTANGSCGYQFSTVAQGAGLQIINCLSYNNGETGYEFNGSGSSGGSTSIDDTLISNCISSFDSGNGFYFDTHGINLMLNNCYSEYSGFHQTEPGGTVTNESITACAYSFTQNNAGAVLSNCIGYQAGSDGLFNGGADVTVVGGKYYGNGYTGTSGGYGIEGTNAGFTNVTGATISGNLTGPHNTTAGYGSFYNCNGLNQASFLSPPSMPASTTGQLNPFNIPVAVTFYGGTLTGVQIKVAGTTSSSMAATSGTFILAPGQTIIPTYSSTAPSWIWIPI